MVKAKKLKLKWTRPRLKLKWLWQNWIVIEWAKTESQMSEAKTEAWMTGEIKIECLWPLNLNSCGWVRHKFRMILKIRLGNFWTRTGAVAYGGSLKSLCSWWLTDDHQDWLGSETLKSSHDLAWQKSLDQQWSWEYPNWNSNSWGWSLNDWGRSWSSNKHVQDWSQNYSNNRDSLDPNSGGK